MLKYQNISTSILEFLRRQIVCGKIKGGERLIEKIVETQNAVQIPKKFVDDEQKYTLF